MPPLHLRTRRPFNPRVYFLSRPEDLKRFAELIGWPADEVGKWTRVPNQYVAEACAFLDLPLEQVRPDIADAAKRAERLRRFQEFDQAETEREKAAA